MSWWQPYQGLPFRDRGRAPWPGVDCWGLVRLIYARHLGVDLPDSPDTASHDSVMVNAVVRAGLTTEPWRGIAAGSEEPFDLAIIWRPYRDGLGLTRTGPIHCGVVTRPQHLIHADEDTGVIELAYAPYPHVSLASRRFEFFRWTGDMGPRGTR